MALWQISFFIIPKDEFESHIQLYKNEDGLFDNTDYWKENVDPLIFKSLDVFLPKVKSWSDNIIQYGTLDSNVFEIRIEDNLIESVSFRINFTSDYEGVLREIIRLCIINSLVILTADLKLMPLNFEIINTYVQQSPQVFKYNSFLN
ncbi:hypothetical protein [Flavobacterium beibuense]|uniref:Uncharacterized protein n=1 Tax=Flavobacterium beibuense TaxID=657326 RepID=A0A444WBT8_9FLAO|nr:hypothetical protein [Flavobacterium beibuense]RYJ43282.1 hypothetical protein NU09_1620 [Flavobacterium beibuense]